MRRDEQGISKTIIAMVAAAALAVLAVVVVVFEPQTLFIDERVDEAAPFSVSTETSSTPTTTSATTPADGLTPPTTNVPTTTVPAGPVVLATGSFGSLNSYSVTGGVVVLTDGSSTFVRFEDLASDNGPDLFVYLSPAPADGSGNFETGSVSLGELKGNVGSQNYEVPAGVSLSDFRSVVIWCDRFSTAFGAAELSVV